MSNESDNESNVIDMSNQFDEIDYWEDNQICTVKKDTDNSGVEDTEDKKPQF